MGKTTKIGWTDHTVNFWWGCTKVSAECRQCYIEKIMKRAGIKQPFGGPVRTKSWRTAYSFNAQAKRDAVRRRVFTCSMSDFFHVGADAWRTEAWNVIRECESLDWLILTKRPERIRECLPSDWGNGYANVWLGTTCGCQSSMHRVELLSDIPATVRFVSAEPLLEAIDLRPYLSRLHWVITGCEQAKRGVRRIMSLDWVRDIDRQCRESGVRMFFKQHYVNDTGVPSTDGMLDGVKRQEWPRPSIETFCS